MKTDIDKHYETLQVAHELVGRVDRNEYPNSSWGSWTRAMDLHSYDIAKALLDLEERRQLALGELGEAMMKDDNFYAVEEALVILNLTKEV